MPFRSFIKVGWMSFMWYPFGYIWYCKLEVGQIKIKDTRLSLSYVLWKNHQILVENIKSNIIN